MGRSDRVEDWRRKDAYTVVDLAEDAVAVLDHLEVGFTFARPLEAAGEVHAGEISESRAAQCIHQRPYDRLRSTYQALVGWMKERGLEPTGPASWTSAPASRPSSSFINGLDPDL